MKKSILYISFLFCNLLYSQNNDFPEPTGNAIIGNQNDLLIYGGAIRNPSNILGVSKAVRIEDNLVIEDNLQIYENLEVLGNTDMSGYLNVKQGEMISLYLPPTYPPSTWRHGLDFYAPSTASRAVNYNIWAGAGVYGTGSSKTRLYMTHGLTPWNSTLGINILPNGNVGIGTLDPVTKLEINVDGQLSMYGDSGYPW